MTEDLLELDAVAEKYFGISPKLARRRAVMNKLPVAAFRLNDSRKGPLFVRKSDIDALVQARAASAEASRINSLTKPSGGLL